METVGLICEYNPFHNGHARQLRLVRQMLGEDCVLVCLMSGNYVQRGLPAGFPKQVRAQAALRCGADLVLELPLTVAVASAEGFAAGGVSILTALGCQRLCFGVETEDAAALLHTAEANLDPAFDALVRERLQSGCSYAAARQQALEALGAGAGVTSPNDILAVEYYKAILRQNSALRPLPIVRTGSYHARTLEPEAPSATALRRALTASRMGLAGDWPDPQAQADAARWRAAVPDCLRALYEAAPLHTFAAGERAVLARLRTLPDTAFAALPYGAEGLWSKLMKNCRRCATVEEILEQTKSKRYARARIQRMLLCAYLGLDRETMEAAPPYVRILGFTDAGQAVLRQMKRHVPLVNAGQQPAAAWYAALENRASDLYDLFSVSATRPAGEEARQRIVRP